MPTGHFTIGDLSFSFEGDLRELAHCQEIMREIRQSEGRLKKASGVKSVVLVYDQDLEGERGTFDKMRLRAYDEEKNYTLDIGQTDTNPLGIYVASGQPIDVWHREKEEGYLLSPDENRSGEVRKEGESSSGSSSGASSGESSGRGAGEESLPGGELEGAAAQLAGIARKYDRSTPAKDISIKGNTLSDKFQGLARHLGREDAYVERVQSVLGGKFSGLTAAEGLEAIRLLASRERLQAREGR